MTSAVSTPRRALRRLLDEHRQARCVAAVVRDRAADPDGWAEYLRDADECDRAAAPVTDRWDTWPEPTASERADRAMAGVVA
jgi:hypothetical protein